MTDRHWPSDFADALVAWARQLQPELGPPIADTLRRCAADLEAERAKGHVLLPLGPVDAARLRASGLVGSHADEGLPLVLDGDALYLARDWEHEQALAARLRVLRAAPPSPIAPEPLRTLFPGTQLDWQALAVAQALRQRFTVISGGPGTGKTSTVLRLLACVHAQQPGARVQLAAPTGKAAQRMLEALRDGLARLPSGLAPPLPAEALTLHRLLGATPGGFRPGAAQPLALDWLIVDEASMLDLALARHLLDALPEHARLVLLGDPDQLAAVENGALLAELSAVPAWSGATRAALQQALALPELALPTEGLQDLAVTLRVSHRFDAGGGIGRLAAAVRDGDLPALDALLAAPPPDLVWHEQSALPALLAEGLRPYAEALRALWQQRGDENAVWQAWDGFRALCAGHAGPWGTRAVHAAAAAWLRTQLPADAPPRLGEALLVTANQTEPALVNGEVLLLLPGDRGGSAPAGLQAVGRRGDARFSLSLARLPERMDGGFALTVHKAQGSEFAEALLLLPEGLEWPTREWLYTGITRVRARLHLLAPAAALRACAARRTQRRSGLARQV